VGSGFVVTFAFIAIYELAQPLYYYYRFVKKKNQTRLKFGLYQKKELARKNKKTCQNLCESSYARNKRLKKKREAEQLKKEKEERMQNGEENSDDNDDNDDDDILNEDDELAQDDEFPMQSDLNAIFMGPPFEVTQKYVHALTLSFIALLFGTGLPMLYPMACLSCFVLYWFDKFLLLRYYARPTTKLGRQVQDSVNRYWGVGVVLHLLFGLWMLSNNIFARKMSDLFFLLKAASAILPDNGKLYYDASVLPFTLAALVTAVIILLPSKQSKSLSEDMKKAFRRWKGKKIHKDSDKAALFTEE
jgi:hypothetical protein